jgi:hypothetical protein
MRPTHTLAVLLLCAALSACASVRPASVDVVLLMGQSNMSGRGALEEIPPGALDPDPRIRVLGNDGIVRVAAEPLDAATNQIDAVSSDKSAGVGPGLAFAKARVARTKRAVLLVPCAKGGTSITQWARSDQRDALYGSCLARAKEAQRLGILAGVLWYQGESDAATADLANAWTERFKRLVTDLRADLDAPLLPLAVVAIGDQPVGGKYAGRFPYWRNVQEAQTALNLPGVVVVEAAGLARNADELHIATVGQITLGERLGRAVP